MACTSCHDNPCETIDCTCRVKISTDCVTYTGEALECSGIESGMILTELIQQLDAFICNKFNDVLNYFHLINVGTGAEIYAGDNNLGEKKIRSLVKTGELIQITQNTDEIDFTIDETALGDFVQENQESYSIANAGVEGVGVYKDETIVGDNIQFNMKKLRSNNILITDIGDYIDINNPDTAQIPSLYVNNAYQPTYQDWVNAGGDLVTNPTFEYKGQGTLVRPFTDTVVFNSASDVDYVETPNTAIQNALDAYVGTGSALLPQLSGWKIVVQNNNFGGYVFPGTLDYSNLNMFLESSVQSTTTGYLVDMDDDTKFDEMSSQFYLTISEEDAVLTIEGDGFNNSGNTNALNNYLNGRIMNLHGDGIIYSYQNDIDKYLINADINDTGNNNGGNLCISVKCKIWADYQGIYKIGGGGRVDFYNELRSGTLTNSVDPDLKAYHQTGGQVRFFQGSQVSFNGTVTEKRTSGFTFTPAATFTPIHVSTTTVMAGGAVNLFHKTTTDNVTLEVTNSPSGYSLDVDEVFESPNLWSVIFKNNTIAYGNIDSTKADLTAGNGVSVINTIGANLIETLKRFPDRSSAQATLPVNAKFINTNSANVDKLTWFIDITME